MVRARKRTAEGKAVHRKVPLGSEYQADIPDLITESHSTIDDCLNAEYDPEIFERVDQDEFDDYLEFALHFVDHECAFETFKMADLDLCRARQLIEDKAKRDNESIKKYFQTHLNSEDKPSEDYAKVTEAEICNLDIFKVQGLNRSVYLRGRSQLQQLYYQRKARNKRYSFLEMTMGYSAEQAVYFKEGKSCVRKHSVKIPNVERCSKCWNYVRASDDECPPNPCGKCPGKDLPGCFDVLFDSEVFKQFVEADSYERFELKNEAELDIRQHRRRIDRLMEKLDSFRINENLDTMTTDWTDEELKMTREFIDAGADAGEVFELFEGEKSKDSIQRVLKDFYARKTNSDC
ncbi:hypothetical protein ACOME3_006795 [Neoechinorhynchus agilis]